MRELIYYIAASVDGRIAGPDGDFTMFPTEGDHFAMITGRFRDAVPAAALTAMGLEPDAGMFDTVIMGWQTYAVGLPLGIDNPYPHLRQYVATRSHAHDVPAPMVATSDPAAVVADLKAEDGSGVWLAGGGQLASLLADEIDQLIVKVNPLLIGSDGIPLFADRLPAGLDLLQSTAFGSGVVIDEYRCRSRPADGRH